MQGRRSGFLKTHKKVEILFHLFHGNKLNDLIDSLDNRAVVELQKFMWEKVVEFGIKTRGKNFNRKEVTRKMTPTPVYQKKHSCSKHPYYCKGTHCIKVNPKCAREKITEHVNVMADSIWEYINKYD